MTTTDHHLPIGDALSFGWDTFKKWPWLLAGVVLAACIAEGIVDWGVENILEENWYGISPLGSLIQWVVNQTVTLGLFNVYLKFRDNGTAEFGDMFTIFPRLPAYLGASIIAGVAVCVGLVLLIVPGIYMLIRLSLVPWVIIDENAGPIEALQRSWDLTRGRAIDLFIFGLLVLGILIAGILALFVGLFVAIPVVGLACTFLYRFLNPSHRSDAVPEAPQV